MRISGAQRAQAGFTLIEILVAFAVLGLVAGAVLSVFSAAPGRISRAENERLVVLAAKSILARVGNEQPVEAGEWQGELSTGGHWKLVIEAYGDTDSGNALGPPPLTSPYLVTVHTTAGPAWNAATANIETIRLRMATP